MPYPASLPNSGTPEIVDLVNLSNHGVPGSFVYRIDGISASNEILPCELGELLWVYVIKTKFRGSFRPIRSVYSAER